MNQLTESYIDSLALNSNAIKNGKDLVKKDKFSKLCNSPDQTLIFGECKGSGSNPYICSVDFIKKDTPIFRCSCPSRQFPCKHNLGLMYAYTTGKPFETIDIPQDIVDKRENAEKREEKKKEAINGDNVKKRKPNKAALVKKISSQLEGIGILEKLILKLIQSGLGSIDKKMLQTLEEQAKQLGNHYIPGAQTALRELLLVLQSDDDRETTYSLAMERLNILYSLVKKSKNYLQSKIDNPEVTMDVDSTLEEWIGHAWQLAELREYGRVQVDAELRQLFFRSYADDARGEYVDEGCWMDLLTGSLRMTRTFRPFRAAKFIREEDSFYDVLKVKELFVYPGDMNPRVRWEDATFQQPEQHDYDTMRSHACKSIPEAVKLVKNQIKTPLADKHPVVLLEYAYIARDRDGFLIVDRQGKQLRLADLSWLNHPTTPLLSWLNRQHVSNHAMLVMFEHDLEHNQLSAQPLSIVTRDHIIRLFY
ncbi:hypothetical protein [Paenibacillus sp. IHBB 10380]|uniref:hypothetical protein n=1 Tax=Paenibacillus sp. IHBB 10380 TaxID=1566358 RepID=UPI0005CFD37F|nr:hypothetical protein [Paenibacillus sp. IHBB 10380]AJS58650.1 hypothetical protein UB51_09300 [Paenibacillus sp. IHBB 10380]